MEITPRQSERWTVLPSWKPRSQAPGLFALSVTINFQGSLKLSRRIRSSWTSTMARMKRRIFKHAAGRLPCRTNWERRRRSRNTERKPLSAMFRMCTAAAAALALFMPLAAQDRLGAELARYEQETDPVRKARALSKLGD